MDKRGLVYLLITGAFSLSLSLSLTLSLLRSFLKRTTYVHSVCEVAVGQSRNEIKRGDHVGTHAN